MLNSKDAHCILVQYAAIIQTGVCFYYAVMEWYNEVVGQSLVLPLSITCAKKKDSLLEGCTHAHHLGALTRFDLK